MVQFKFFPFTQKEVPEWYQRLQDLTGGNLPSKTVAKVEEEKLPELGERYFSLADVEIIRLAKKYGAGYVLTTCKDSHDIALVFSNEKYCVYKPEARAGL